MKLWFFANFLLVVSVTPPLFPSCLQSHHGGVRRSAASLPSEQQHSAPLTAVCTKLDPDAVSLLSAPERSRRSWRRWIRIRKAGPGSALVKMEDLHHFWDSMDHIFVQPALCFVLGSCSRCREAVNTAEGACRAMGQVFHVRCFTCSVCSESSWLRQYHGL